MIGWVDASIGASGDMLLGALVGAGADLAAIQSAVDSLGVAPIGLRSESVQRQSISATRVHVEVGTDTARSYADIRGLLRNAALDARVREASEGTFERLARAEAAVHGTSIDDVHFHEVGALDSLADVVGVCAAVADLGWPALSCSAIAVGSGTARTQHGVIPIPAPATLGVLAQISAPIVAGPIPHEACTPTAAALLAQLCTSFGEMPALKPSRIGTGAGGRDPNEAANVLRVVLGEPTTTRRSVVLEANIDDQDPRLWPLVIETLIAAGASDAWLSPIVMKKGRPAYTLHVLCHDDQIDALSTAIFEHTTTIGLRISNIDKRALDRRMGHVEVDGVQIAVKYAGQDGRTLNVSVEFEDAKAAAATLGRPLKEIMQAATAAALRIRD